MSNQPTATLKRLKWRLECIAYSTVEMAAGLLPGPWVFRVGEALGGLAWHLMRHRRHMVERNLRIAYAGEKDSSEIRSLAKATMRRAGANLISAAYTARLSPRQLSKILQLENLELLRESLDKGRGVMLLLAHMGNWELLSRLIYLLPEGTKTGAFYRPLNNPILDRQVLARRQADGTRMFSKRDPFHQVANYLRKGALVGVLADQRVGYRGDKVHFFGRCTYSSPLPSLLARRTKCDVLAFALVTVKPGVWKGTFMPVEQPPTTQNCMHGLQAAMEPYPIDVFWLQERWKARVHNHAKALDLLTEAEAASEKPPRVLIWAAGMPADWRPDDQWLSTPVSCEYALLEGEKRPVWVPDRALCHQVPPCKSAGKFQKSIRVIDRHGDLPLDLILMAGDFDAIRKAAQREGINALPL